MIKLGLTGSIGMGKSAVSQMLTDLGIPVHDADAAVHEIYQGVAVDPVQAAFGNVITEGIVDRMKLREIVLNDPAALAKLNAITHPLVAEHRDRFIEKHAWSDIIVFDVPLLYETGGEKFMDKVMVVSAPPAVQRQRVLARPGMTKEVFESILAKQVPDLEKRKRADFVIDTATTMTKTKAAVKRVIDNLRKAHVAV